MKYPDPITGQKFGKLKCTNPRIMKAKNGNWLFEMTCECGNKRMMAKYDLYVRNYSSCGCFRKNAMRKFPGEITYNGLYDSCKQGAKARGIEFYLTRTEHKNLIVQHCSYCGKPPQPYNFYVKKDGSSRKTSKNTRQSTVDLSWIIANGIDRKDNDKGYILENCIPCCSICNIGKGVQSADFYIDHCKSVALYHKDSV